MAELTTNMQGKIDSPISYKNTETKAGKNKVQTIRLLSTDSKDPAEKKLAEFIEFIAEIGETVDKGHLQKAKEMRNQLEEKFGFNASNKNDSSQQNFSISPIIKRLDFQLEGKVPNFNQLAITVYKAASDYVDAEGETGDFYGEAKIFPKLKTSLQRMLTYDAQTSLKDRLAAITEAESSSSEAHNSSSTALADEDIALLAINGALGKNHTKKILKAGASLTAVPMIYFLGGQVLGHYSSKGIEEIERAVTGGKAQKEINEEIQKTVEELKKEQKELTEQLAIAKAVKKQKSSDGGETELTQAEFKQINDAIKHRFEHGAHHRYTNLPYDLEGCHKTYFKHPSSESIIAEHDWGNGKIYIVISSPDGKAYNAADVYGEKNAAKKITENTLKTQRNKDETKKIQYENLKEFKPPSNNNNKTH